MIGMIYLTEPVPLRCRYCEEIIYRGQEYSDHGDGYGDDWLPAHDTCIAAREKAEQIERRRFISDLPRMRTSDHWEDRVAAVSFDMAHDLARSIFETGSEFLGPGALERKE